MCFLSQVKEVKVLTRTMLSIPMVCPEKDSSHRYPEKDGYVDTEVWQVLHSKSSSRRS